MRTKIFENAAFFFLSVGHSVRNYRRTFTADNSIGNSASDRRALRDVWFPSVMSVGDCCRWFRRKLWHKPVMFFQLSMEYRRHYSISDGRRWLPSESPLESVATLCNLFPTLYEIPTELFRRCYHQFNIYAASTWIFFYPPAHLDHTQHNNRSWQLKKNKYFMFQNITL